ncbi:MAG: hypothetical protein AB7P99_09710 [Vicinamibacterales bacterium]
MFNRYTIGAYVLASIFIISFAGDLYRMPIQVGDSMEEILGAEQTPSVTAMFVQNLVQVAYLRPLRRAQIKAVFDLSGGRYHLAYRGVHVVLFAITVWLFVRALKVAGPLDFAAGAFALTVLLGSHTFSPAMGAAYPINHFLQITCYALAALNLAQARPGWTRDLFACVLFVAAALTLESGLLVWVVLAAAWVIGFRGVSSRGVAAVTVLLAGYMLLRFAVLDVGAPALTERASGFLFEMLESDELQARFGSTPFGFYAYNVVSSAASVLFAEPRAGVFVATRALLEDTLLPREVVPVVTSTLTTSLIAAAAWLWLRRRAPVDDNARLIAVFAAVLAANSVISYGYTKSDIVGVAGAFYAVAAFAALRALVAAAPARRPAVNAVCGLMIAIAAAGWAIRTAGLHYLLVDQAFKQRLDWVSPPLKDATTPARLAIVQALRADALERRPAIAPAFRPGWVDRWFESLY